MGACPRFLHSLPVITVPREVELKLDLQSGRATAASRIGELLAGNLAGPQRVEQLESLYFDTPDGKLHDHGVSFRIRRNGKQILQTIKCVDHSSLFERGEWETELVDSKPDWQAAERTDIRRLLTKRLRRSVKPLFTTKVRRTTFPLRTERANIEIALDSGSIVAEGRAQPIQELELELKGGDASELFRLARELSRAVPARVSLKSKAEKGYQLLHPAAPGALKAASIELSSELQVPEAFRVIARSCLAQILGNEAAVEQGHPEALHQMRIGLRRLRASMWFFSPVLAGPQTDVIKSELKWLTRELSPARDFDVYLSQVPRPFREKYEEDPQFQGLCREFERKRDEAFRRVQDAIRSDRYRHLLIETAGWIEAGDWCRAGNDSPRERTRTIEDYAAEQLARRRKKIVKKSKRFDRLDATERHKLRIQIKKFRYASEFLEAVFTRGKAKHRWRGALNATKQIQDCLGALNDIAAHEKLSLEVLHGLGKGNGALGAGGAFLAGLIAGQREAESPELADAAATALKAFRSAKPFWK